MLGLHVHSARYARAIVYFLATEQGCEVVRSLLPGAMKKILARGGGKERLSTSITIVTLTVTGYILFSVPIFT